MSIVYQLNPGQEMKRAEALLRFASMQIPASRETVIADLPLSVSLNIPRSNIAIADVLSIVRTCLSNTGAIEILIERVKLGQETSIYLQRLNEVELEVLPPLAL